MWEKSGSQIMAKNALGQSDFIIFNCQYLRNGLTSDSNFLHVDRHEWTRQGLLMGSLKKYIYISGQMSHFGSKSGVSLCEISLNERGQEVHGNYINDFSKKIHI